MAKYNTFLVISTKGASLLVTSSARKARKLLAPGARVEVWAENKKTETIYTRTAHLLSKYVTAEKEYIKNKQAKAEERNKKRRQKHETLRKNQPGHP